MAKSSNFVSKKQKNNSLKARKISFDAWLKVTQQLFQKNKKKYNIFQRVKYIIQKHDINKDVSKELIRKLADKKINYSEAYILSDTSAKNVKASQQKMIYISIGLITGILLFIISSIIILMHFNIIKLIVLLTSIVIFLYALYERNKFEKVFMGNLLLMQASGSYTIAKMPGKGGSIAEAYQQLDINFYKK